MTDVKITQLPSATLPLSGTEIVPLVQSGTTVQAAISNISVQPPSIAALRTLNPAGYTELYVAGYYTVGDGGGGYFKSATGQPPGAYVDNGGTIIVPTGGDGSSAWLRVIQGALSVAAFGAIGSGDETAKIQAAIDTGKDIVFPASSYTISAPLQIGSQRITGGTSSKYINRTQTRINVPGNHAAFVHKAGFPSFIIDGFFIYFSDTTPTDQATNGLKRGFSFTNIVTGWPEIAEIKNCTVQGAWWAYYDNIGTYLSKLTQVIGRNCKSGFYKSGGTTIQFNTCASANGTSGFRLDNVLSPSLTNCACDLLTPNTLTSTLGAGNLFISCQSLVINGWDAEGNAMNTNSGGGDASLFLFQDTVATISGFFGFNNTFETSGGGSGAGVNLFRAENNSRITILGSQDVFTGAIPYTGTGGYPSTLQTDSTSWITVINSQFGAASGGSPASTAAATGNVAFTNSLVTGAVLNGYNETKDRYGIKAGNFYTLRGSTVVSAGVATNTATLSNATDGAYIYTVWLPNGGTTEQTAALIFFDGTNWTSTYLKAGANLTIGISGTNIQATSTAGGTLSWSVTRIAI